MAGEMIPTENQRNRREIMYITKESQIKRVRAVIVYDISIRNNLKELNEVTAILENHAQRMVFPLGVKVHQTQSEIILKTIRGQTGPLSDVVWRGTRGPNKRKGESTLDYDHIRTLNEAGMKVADIAKELNCSRQSVYVVLRATRV
jgi:hypothetical protein